MVCYWDRLQSVTSVLYNSVASLRKHIVLFWNLVCCPVVGCCSLLTQVVLKYVRFLKERYGTWMSHFRQLSSTQKLISCWDCSYLQIFCFPKLIMSSVSADVNDLAFSLHSGISISAGIYSHLTHPRCWSYLRLWNKTSVVRRQRRDRTPSLSEHVWSKCLACLSLSAKRRYHCSLFSGRRA